MSEDPTHQHDSQSDPTGSPGQERKLVAILFADIAGYTSLMQANEKNAAATLKLFQTKIKEKTAQYKGKIVNFYGDGALMVFNTPFEAMQCVRNLQTFFIENDIPVRMGLHSGTVVFDGDQVYGDSVNLASRIESMGVAGSVLYSENIRRDIKNHPEFRSTYLGTFEFKNVGEPLGIFALRNEGFAVPKPGEIKGKLKLPRSSSSRLLVIWGLGAILFAGLLIAGYFYQKNQQVSATPLAEKPSIVILPYENLSSDPEQEFFAYGIADEIRSALSAIERLKVISRSSSHYFKGKNVSQKEIAQTLKVNHVLSGSVLQFQDQIKINVELSNALTDEVEWSMNTTQRALNDIFDIQQEIALEVATQLRININDQEMARLFKFYLKEPETYALFVKNWTQMLLDPFRSSEHAIKDFEGILEKEPNNVPVLRALATAYMIRGLFAEPMDSARAKASSLFLKAEQLDEHYQFLAGQYGYFKFWYEWDFDAALEYAKKGLAVNDEWSINILVDYYFKTGNLEEARKMLEKLGDINPLHLFHGSYISRYHMHSGNYEQAEQYGLRSAQKNPSLRESYFDLGRLYLLQNRNQEAADILEKGIQNFGFRTPYLTGYLAMAYHRLGQTDKFKAIIHELEGLWENKAPGSSAFYLGMIHCQIGQPDKGFEWLERSFEARDIEMTWLKMDPAFEPVREDPRYQDLLKRVGFPVPLLD